MAIELRHLRYAVAAAHYGSFRRAAEALGVKQSSLSRRVRQMEDRLGVAVFERSSSGVRLTTAGTEILRASRHLVDGLDHMMASAKAAGRGEVGRLAIGFYTSLSAGNLRASLTEQARRFPEVEIRTVEGARASLCALRRAAVQQHHVGMLGVDLVKPIPDQAVIVEVQSAGDGDLRARRYKHLGLGSAFGGDIVAAVDHGRGEIAVVDHRSAARPPG